jgi:hypothetical protein
MIQESSSLHSKKLATDQFSRDEDEVAVVFLEKYSILITNIILQSMREGNKIFISWNKNEKRVNNNNDSYCLDSQLVRVILVKLENLNVNDFLEGYLIKGYTRATTKTTEGNKNIFYAHPSFQGKRWYDWAYVHFEDINASGDVVENYYPARNIGFVTTNRITKAVIHC